MRLTAIIAISGLAVAAHAQGIFFENNTYRSGGAYVQLMGSTPSDCAMACAQDQRCDSFSYIRYDALLQAPRCELKAGFGVKESDPNAISGISPAIEAEFLDPVPAEYIERNAEGDRELMGAATAPLAGLAPAPLKTRPMQPGLEKVEMIPPASPRLMAPEVRTVTPNDGVPNYSVQREPRPLTENE